MFKNLNFQLPGRKSKTILTELGQSIQIDFSCKLNNKKLNGGHQILIARDRFSNWPTAKVFKSSETKEVLNFLKQNFILYGLPAKLKPDKGGERSSRKNTMTFVTRKTLELNITHRECIPVLEQ